MGRTATTAGAPMAERGPRTAGTPPGPARARPGHARAARVARGRAPTREIVT